jgi:NAD(P)-dependent dehydrogenase (short-subunit alcohol dehydrogenase family)
VDLKLDGKAALVTGSTAGIGLAIAEALAREGASVVVNGRTEARVRAAVETVQAAAPRAKVRGIAVDLATAAGAARVVKELPELDVLVNNLGIYEAKPFAEISDADWHRLIETNVLSGVRLSRHYLPAMLRKNWGRVLFMSSESGVNIPQEMIHYGVTKSAQIALARGLAEMTVGTNVTVNSVLAGPTRSEGVEGFVKTLSKQRGITEAQLEKEFFATMRPSSLIKRFADPAEVGSLVAFFASPVASATNGAALRVEGGVVRSIL